MARNAITVILTKERTKFSHFKPSLEPVLLTTILLTCSIGIYLATKLRKVELVLNRNRKIFLIKFIKNFLSRDLSLQKETKITGAGRD